MNDEEPNALYRIYARDGRLLYVGISVQPAIRLAEHRRAASWWPEVDVLRTRIEWMDGRLAEAEIARTAGVDRMTVRKWLGK